MKGASEDKEVKMVRNNWCSLVSCAQMVSSSAGELPMC